MSLTEIKNIVHRTETKFSRNVGSTKIIAVSKVQPNDRVQAVLESGHRIFGENRIQEAQSKWPEFKQHYDNIELHIIGPLQTNKTRAAMELADSIHTVDRPKLAKSIARIAQEIGKCPELFVQVNTGEEKQKSGILPKEAKSFVKECQTMDLPIKGLMCIPPNDNKEEKYFLEMLNLKKQLDLNGLSMGMSNDYLLAIKYGSTYVRIGSKIFGLRN